MFIHVERDSRDDNLQNTTSLNKKIELFIKSVYNLIAS